MVSFHRESKCVVQGHTASGAEPGSKPRCSDPNPVFSPPHLEVQALLEPAEETWAWGETV